jgi:hypothetical protein
MSSNAMSPSRSIVLSVLTISSTMSGAKPSVGSSMISRRGLHSNARPIASICCSPPDKAEP